MVKLITVFGSTGNQGGSVIRAILSHPILSKEWKIRGVTRNANKPDAQALASKGVEMVSADLNSQPSLEAAITSSTAVFGVTNYWEQASLAHEVQQGKNLTNACRAAGVEHLIWSSLPHVSRITAGKLHNLHHFDSKALVEEYITELGQLATFVMPAYFMANVLGSIKWVGGGDGKGHTYTAMFAPDTSVPMIDVARDFGKFVAAALLRGPSGTHVYAASGWVTPMDVCRAVESVSGKSCAFMEVKEDEFGGSMELLDNLKMIREYGYFGPGAEEGVARSQKEVEGSEGWEGFGTFEGFLRESGI